ncbi:hypothetical protein [Pseudomonas sp. R3.Fl]|nr:hypothetical protein [Pseudomonas sp. R3.Fl]
MFREQQARRRRDVIMADLTSELGFASESAFNRFTGTEPPR